jgi:hypothetical protein
MRAVLPTGKEALVSKTPGQSGRQGSVGFRVAMKVVGAYIVRCIAPATASWGKRSSVPLFCC